MLRAGGIPVVADEDRRDEFNPDGYFEIPPNGVPGVEPGVAPLLEYCRGRAAKVTALALPRLYGAAVPLRVVLMRRDLDACAGSFARLNAARALPQVPRSVVEFVTSYGQRVADELTQHVLRLSFEGTVRDPAAAAKMLGAFIGQPFDEAAAARVVRRPGA
jgi:hypothetical protein